MALRTYQLTLAATQKRLSDVYIGSAGGGSTGTPDARTDIPYRQVTLQAEAAAVYIGSDATVATNLYGATLASGASITLGPFDQGPVKLSDFYLVGSGATLHVVGVPY